VKHLFKEKQYRPLGILLVLLLMYLVIVVVGLAFALLTDHTPFKQVIDWYGIGLSVYSLVFCSVMWWNSYKDSVEREKKMAKYTIPYDFSNRELAELKKLGIASRYLQPIDYKKNRRQTAWLWATAILANLLALSTHFW
jgi:hypothetical protein